MIGTIFSLAAPAILGPLGFSPMVASAIGGGIGSLLQGGDTQDALRGAALGGLGGYLGGKLGGGGSSAFGPNPAAPTFGTGNPNIAGKMYAGIEGLPAGVDANALGTIAGQQAVTPGITDMLTRPEAIGAGLGGMMADSMQMPEYQKPEEDEEMPRGMPIKNTSVFPEMGYDAGKKGEFDYRIAKNYAEGGEVEGDMSPMDMGLGGMTKDGMNDKELISSAIDVIQGEIQDPDQQKVILGQFIAEFGQEALQDLMQRVQSGDIPTGQQEGDGMVEGAGDGMADMIPASMEGDQDVLLSDGEFVVPADVVSGIGNGSSDAGADKLEGMMDRVRELRTGGMAQPPAVPDEMMLPA
jgi:hypothetical protein